jgi:hypothetical protein
MIFRIYNYIRTRYSFFVKYSKKNKSFVFSNYIPESTIQSNRRDYMSRHSNKIENNLLIETFVKNGFNYIGISDRFVIKQLISLLSYILNNKIQIILYQDERFLDYFKEIEDKTLIYYITGCHYIHQNRWVIERTNLFNNLNKTNIPYYRLARPTMVSIIPNVFFYIGNTKTLSTFKDYDNRTFIKSGTIFVKSNLFNYEEKLKKVATKSFLWLGSEGTLLRGLDIIVNYFQKNKDIELHIVGNIDYELRSYFQNHQYDNIFFHGYLNIDSISFLEIIYRCQWVINLSFSEGIPGSLINAMSMGCIPIMSEFSVYSDDIRIGYVVNPLDIKNLDSIISITKSLSEVEVRKMMDQSITITEKLFTIEEFKNKAQNLLSMLLKLNNN